MHKIKSVELPQDNGPHNFVVEWWYFNGHLYDSHGKEYSFMDCFFKVNLEKVKIPHISPRLVPEILRKGEYLHFAHSVVSDISKGKSYKEIQNISLISDDTFKKDLLFINYKNANILGEQSENRIVEISPNNFHIKTKNLDLVLESNKKPLLEGGHGYVGTPQNGSYYYSFTDMSVSGKIVINGKEIEVSGKSWMDHQWADASYKNKDKWTWFSFSLEDGTDIMCVEYDTLIGVDILIDVIDKEGNQTQYKKAKIIPNRKYWKSKKTKAVYPLSWNIEIDNNIKIKTKAFIKEQEMIFGQINYWEGSMSVEAIINNKKIKGRGFMELVGYPSDYNYLMLEGKELEKSLLKKIKSFIRKI